MGRSLRAASALVFAGVAAFVALSALAAAAYPGGTFCDAHAPGYRFWENFFCDLTQPLTQRGQDNSRSRALAEASFVCFSFALAGFYWLAGASAGVRLGRLIRVFGLVSACGANVIAWLPSGVSPFLHQLSVFAATIPGLLATSLAAFCEVVRSPGGEPRRLRAQGVLAAGALALGLIDAVYYAYAVAVPGCYVWLPALQKAAAICLLAWMLLVARGQSR